ncbi:MAG: Nif3-like dinuclear metal center hexameric protein [Methylophilaceae bacterium 17-44-8]|jgi:dinuclear metal center YbgI/SA1388 family protein|nr:MAG: Nif3-like dinuclear metal center hexameric protein [Methylophilales bacterium 28-44-11]OZA06216.1 MAG: Nif3-like dinuclear metal center hexameric protein [Methylophilaceae bacterium 17-44-8]
MKLSALNNYLKEILQPARFNDYCPNGLQVEGKPEIYSIVTGVTASQALIDHAVAVNADAILVHHGYFWRGEPAEIVGMKKRRIQTLMQHNINLFAYHLPLDAHPQFGNNVMLGKQLNMPIEQWLDDKQMVAKSTLSTPITLEALAAIINMQLGRTPQVIASSKSMIQTVAWCTGAAQQYIDVAIAAEVDVFISGEISEQTTHAVRESSTAYIAAGHHATERYGIQALGQHLAQQFGLKHEFVDIDNPV